MCWAGVAKNLFPSSQHKNPLILLDFIARVGISRSWFVRSQQKFAIPGPCHILRSNKCQLSGSALASEQVRGAPRSTLLQTRDIPRLAWSGLLLCFIRNRHWGDKRPNGESAKMFVPKSQHKARPPGVIPRSRRRPGQEGKIMQEPSKTPKTLKKVVDGVCEGPQKWLDRRKTPILYEEATFDIYPLARVGQKTR